MGELYQPYPKLPKNIRQIGEWEQAVKLYIEDYVNTYLKRLQPSGLQDLRVGVLLGSMELQDGTPYLFVDGAMELEDVTEPGEQVVFTETAWKRADQCIEEMFPRRTVLGWFLCGGQGSQLSPFNYWKQHGQYFSEKNQVMYLNSGLEGEEAVYMTSEDGFYKLRGHSIYYERNQMMQDYMVLRKDAGRVETGHSDNIIKDFRQRMDEHKTETMSRQSTIGLLSGLTSALSIVVLAGGIVMFNNYHKMQEMESVIASVLPQGVKEWGQLEEEEIVIQRPEGKVYPTKETETMSSERPDGEKTASIHQQASEDGREPETEDGQNEKVSEPENDQDREILETEKSQSQTDHVPAAVSGTYTVGAGETLYGICLAYYGNLEKLDTVCEVNGLTDVDHIVAGQTLIMP